MNFKHQKYHDKVQLQAVSISVFSSRIYCWRSCTTASPKTHRYVRRLWLPCVGSTRPRLDKSALIAISPWIRRAYRT